MAWIGAADLRAAADSTQGLGPIAQSVEALQFDSLSLLSNYSADPSGKKVGMWATILLPREM
jgi:hypothetical protein